MSKKTATGAVISLTKARMFPEAIVALKTATNVPGDTLAELVTAGYHDDVRQHLRTRHNNVKMALGVIKIRANDDKVTGIMGGAFAAFCAVATPVTGPMAVVLAPASLLLGTCSVVSCVHANVLNKFVAAEMKE
jgi:hypothetical protein